MKSILLVVLAFALGPRATFNANQFINSPSIMAPKFLPGPSTIIDFKAERLSGLRVELSWHTQDEMPGLNFEVERRKGEDESFTGIGKVNCKGKGADALCDYNFIDTNAFDGETYYRLRQKDVQGINYYSIMRTVKGPDKQAFTKPRE